MKKKNGFTLTELLVTIAMLAVVGTVIIYSTIGLTNNSKETQYSRMIENIINSAKTYVSLYPEDFGDLYSSKAFTYVSLDRLVEVGLLDEEQINPFTNKQIDFGDNLEGRVKVYVNGDTKEMSYKYPLEDSDIDTVYWLQTTTIFSYTNETESGGDTFNPVFAFSGVPSEDIAPPTNDFAVSTESGILYKSSRGSHGVNIYRVDFNMTYEMPDSFVKCTSSTCSVSNIPTGASIEDYYLPTKTGTFRIKYKWEYANPKKPEEKISRTDERIVRVVSSSEAEKEKINTSVKVSTSETTTARANGIIYELDGTGKFKRDTLINTGVQLFLEDEENPGYLKPFTIVVSGGPVFTAAGTDMVLLDARDTNNSSGFYAKLDAENYKSSVLTYFNHGNPREAIISTPETHYWTYTIIYNPRINANAMTIQNYDTKKKVIYKNNNAYLARASDVELYIGGFRSGTNMFNNNVRKIQIYNYADESLINNAIADINNAAGI